MSRYRRTIVLTSLCLLAGMQIASRADYSEDIPSTLKRYELEIFGQVQSGAILDRVRALEKNLWRKPQDGTLPERLDRIGQMLSRTSNPASQTSQPPRHQAPELQYSDRQPAQAALPPPAVQPAVQPASNAVAKETNKSSPSVDKHRVASNLLDQAMQAYKNGNAAEAQRLFLAVLNMEPENCDANYNLGVIAEGRKDYATARNYYRNALKDSPGDASLIDAVKQMDHYLSLPAYAPR